MADLIVLITIFLFLFVFLFFFYGSLNDIFLDGAGLRSTSTNSLARYGSEALVIIKAGGLTILALIRRWWFVFVVLIALTIVFDVQALSEPANPFISRTDVAISNVFIPGWKLLTNPIRTVISILNSIIPFTNAIGGAGRVFFNSAVE